MKLKNILIVVEDVEKSKAFYKDLFGLSVVADLGGNVILTEGLVLQDRAVWEVYVGKKVVGGGHDAELYFEESDMDGFLAKLDSSEHEIMYLNRHIEQEKGQRVVHLYDPDGHVIEVREVSGAPLRKDI